MIIDVKDVAITIACIECMQNMHIEMRLMDCYINRLVVAALCKCGKFLGALHRFRYQAKYDRRQLDLVTPDQIGAWGCEMRERAQKHMQMPSS